mmetsp:Transcript_14887/g.46214  ORF Transcript_14887/g.46214 Transcript_14887/m.46214 type:complete len:295 (+) Transcript_14887:234-1118(+)
MRALPLLLRAICCSGLAPPREPTPTSARRVTDATRRRTPAAVPTSGRRVDVGDATRRRLLAAAPTLLITQPSLAADAPAELIRKGAANLPGLGPPDVLYPITPFKGRWRVKRTVAGRTEPLGPDATVSAGLLAVAPAAETYETRFIEYGDGEHVVVDRAFEAEQRAAAGAYGDGLLGSAARWDPGNPNVCTLDKQGALLELKVTKRSFESPGPGAFGSSEYSRVAFAAGGVAAVPVILARRVQTRLRWEDGDSKVEGLEIHSIYDPTATGFGDLNGASPVLVLKSRLLLERVVK